MSMIKYRIHEVAKDFGLSSKEISQILTDYVAPPRNHMQVLETNELDVIFEYLTQHNQAASLEEIFKTPEKAALAKAGAAKKPADGKPAKPADAKPQKGASAQTAAPANTQTPAPAQVPAAPAQEKKSVHVPRQVAEKRVVDTRGGAAVNIEKYNEKFEDMAGAKANSSNMRRQNKQQGKAARQCAGGLRKAQTGRARQDEQAPA